MNNDRLYNALFSEALPGNPLPFLAELSSLVRLRGTDSIHSDDAKRLLWCVMTQSYGQLSTIDLSAEWDRLYQKYGTTPEGYFPTHK